MHNIIHPNLPDSFVGRVLVKGDKKTVSALKAMGIEVISPKKNPHLSEETAEHSDMLFFLGENGRCVISPEQTELAEKLTCFGFSVKKSASVSSPYPNDVKLNFALCKNRLIGNFTYADKALLESVFPECKRLSVNQGYAKCSLCIVNENAFITEDAGIARTLQSTGARVLHISHGDVFLSGEHYGFLGGATGKLSKDILAINGSLSCHRDGEKIREFLREENVRPLELFRGQITDIGGIIPLAVIE